MRPLQGPVDYHRYPPRKRRTRPATSRRVTSPVAIDENPKPREERELHREHEDKSRRENESKPLRETRYEHEVAHRHTPPESVRPKNSDSNNQKPTSKKASAKSSKTKPSKPLWQRLRKLFFFLCFLLLAEGVFAAFTSPKMAVQNVTVEGLNYTDANRVLTTQRSLTGQNWLRVRLADAERELEKIPTVKSAQVSRVWSWPPGVSIQVEERQGAVRIGAANNWWIADETGMIFRRASKEDEKLYAVTHPLVTPQEGKALPPEHWENIAQLTNALQQSKTPWNLRRVHFDRQGFASLRLTGGVHDETLIQLGNDLWPEKLQRAGQTLDFIASKGQRASTINLVSYLRPTWTPRAQPQDGENGSQAGDDSTNNENAEP